MEHRPNVRLKVTLGLWQRVVFVPVVIPAPPIIVPSGKAQLGKVYLVETRQ